MYSSNFTVDYKIFSLILHYNSDNSCLFVNGKELIKYPVCLGGLSKDYTENSRNDTGLYAKCL